MLRVPLLAAFCNRRLALVDVATIVDDCADRVGGSCGVFECERCAVRLVRQDSRKRLLADVEAVQSASWIDVERAPSV